MWVGDPAEVLHGDVDDHVVVANVGERGVNRGRVDPWRCGQVGGMVRLTPGLHSCRRRAWLVLWGIAPIDTDRRSGTRKDVAGVHVAVSQRHPSHRLIVRSMAELLDDIRAQINTRIGELRPFVDEAERLQGALDALNTTGGARAQPDGRRARRVRASGQSVTGNARQQVPIAAAVIDYIRANPGATAGDVATALGRRRSSIATRLTQLAKKGELSKAKRGYTAH
jgi:hypothetical protein